MNDFWKLHCEVYNLKQWYLEGIDSHQKAFIDEVTAAYRALYPRRRKFDDGAKIQKDLPNFDAIKQKRQEVFLAWANEQKAIIEEKMIELCKLAKDTEVPKSDKWLQIEQCSGMNYCTQGYGANKYAKGEAETKALLYQHYDIDTEVREISTFQGYDMSYITYALFVKTTKEGRELMEFKPRPSLRETVKSMLKRHINPWVQNPYLSQDYMEKEGLDWQGNDIVPAAKAA